MPDPDSHFNFVIKVGLYPECFDGQCHSTPKWSDILTEGGLAIDAGHQGYRAIKTNCMNPLTGSAYSSTPLDQAKRDKVFFRLADNLLDYITKLRGGEITSDEHDSLWLAVFGKGRQWVNHNKDVGTLHFKFVDKNRQSGKAEPLPELFPRSCPCPRGTPPTRPTLSPTHQDCIRQEQGIEEKLACLALAPPKIARAATCSVPVVEPESDPGLALRNLALGLDCDRGYDDSGVGDGDWGWGDWGWGDWGWGWDWDWDLEVYEFELELLARTSSQKSKPLQELSLLSRPCPRGTPPPRPTLSPNHQHCIRQEQGIVEKLACLALAPPKIARAATCSVLSVDPGFSQRQTLSKTPRAA